MDFKWTGEQPITLRGIEFENGKAVSVDPSMAQKLSNFEGFVEVKAKPKAKAKKDADKG